MSVCPHREHLQKLEAGELDDEIAEQVFSHVEKCTECHAALEWLRKEDLDTRILKRAVGRKKTGEPVADNDANASGSEWDVPDYERVRLCGEGAFGTVWAVRDRVGVHRALKVIDLTRMAQVKAKCRELTALEAYCRHVAPHPNLIEVAHVGMHGEKLYYTMELADDDRTRSPVRDEVPARYSPLTLQAVLRGRTISVDTAIEVVLRLLRGLANLHRVGLAHRDIKPANIVFVEGQPKLSDIGMITSTAATPSHVGTPEYMPPDRQMDLTADTYAMGRVLYDLLTSGVGNGFPKLPPHVTEAGGVWDMERVGLVLKRASAPAADGRYPNAERMHAALESCRHWSLNNLFAELSAEAEAIPKERMGIYAPVVVAAINALPWLLGLILAIVLAQKLL